MGSVDTGLATGVGLALAVELSFGAVVAGFDDAGFRATELFGVEVITGGGLGFAALKDAGLSVFEVEELWVLEVWKRLRCWSLGCWLDELLVLRLLKCLGY